ncbi:MAG: hypothetical protein RMJ88_13145 [Thermogemmata sp.]|nr:hypothetical protein [Thermogemmata sp.]
MSNATEMIQAIRAATEPLGAELARIDQAVVRADAHAQAKTLVTLTAVSSKLHKLLPGPAARQPGPVYVPDVFPIPQQKEV